MNENAEQMNKPSISYILDPRFPGGTSSAVAAELELVKTFASVKIYAVSTEMFSGQEAAPQLRDVLLRLNLDLIWGAGEIADDIVIFHNPSCLKYQNSLDIRIIAKHLIVVSHENFLRPGEAEAFDVGKCLGQIDASSVALTKRVAPISAGNRSTVQKWFAAQSSRLPWSVLDVDWFNVCALVTQEPSSKPTDRRGRHSRPGFEKFPQQDVMELCFPPNSVSNVILGADSFINARNAPSHWTLYPFRGLSLPQYFDRIDFMVYFTAPTWRESFGRVLAEAMAAGKLVITDHDTAANFEGAVISAEPRDVDQIIQSHISNPERYRANVLAGQEKLSMFSQQRFESQIGGMLIHLAGGPT